jgi:hypothetical protein
MPFVLTVIRPDGSDYQYETEDGGFAAESKHAAALAILQVFVNHEVSISVGEARQVVREVLDAPTGTTMSHPASRYSFRIEEAEEF